jgi:hypothetical protein
MLACGRERVATPQPDADRDRRPTATPRPTPTARPAPSAAPAATPVVTPVPPGGVSDLCEPFLGFACGLGAGAYQPSAFEPALRFVLGDGWSTTLSERDIIALGRAEGALTIAGDITAIHPR